MSVRWQHFIDHADTKQKPANVTRLSSRRSSAAERQSVKRDYVPGGVEGLKSAATSRSLGNRGLSVTDYEPSKRGDKVARRPSSAPSRLLFCTLNRTLLYFIRENAAVNVYLDPNMHTPQHISLVMYFYA